MDIFLLVIHHSYIHSILYNCLKEITGLIFKKNKTIKLFDFEVTRKFPSFMPHYVLKL